MVEEIISLEFEKPVTELEKKIASLKISEKEDNLDLSAEIHDLEEKCIRLKGEIYSSMNPWQKVQLARHSQRPYTLDYVRLILSDFMELHGDRAFMDDKAMICGLGLLDDIPVAIVGQQKGRDLKENMERNFAMAHPEGYRKALRIMKLAEKFGCPIITFIDTPGAYPGIAAEERGQAEAIARNLREMADLKVPVVSVVIGEGGSGGALGIGVANKILMLENSYYSVISPEGCAAILFHDAGKAAESAAALKITAQDLLETGVVDEIIPEPLGGAHRDVKFTADKIKESLLRNITELNKLSAKHLVETRYFKYRKIGVYKTAKTESKKKAVKSKAEIVKSKY